jgi:LAO/AO transport system kinase
LIYKDRDLEILSTFMKYNSVYKHNLTMSKFDENNWILRRKVYKSKLTFDYFIHGIESGNRKILAEAITLIESENEKDRDLANDIIDTCLPKSGKSIRIGVTGVPGVGKSTFIETVGLQFLEKGKKVAVLSIDPSSITTKGSILGDKTRMELLSKSENAFIRPSSAGKQLGGIAKHTKEAMLLCEAAGFDVIIIETVGVGQSETMVYNMVDFFLLLMLAGAGDELQGIKRGIMEVSDAIVITKSDGQNIQLAKKAVNAYKTALHYFPQKNLNWVPKVLDYSFINKKSVEKVIQLICDYFSNSEFIIHKRKEQEKEWMYEHFKNLVLEDLTKMDKNIIENVLSDLNNNKTNAFKAAQILFTLFKKNEKN